MTHFQIGDRVRVHLDEKFGPREGWYTGTIFKIDPYSRYRDFYWVELDAEARSALGLRQISVFNPKNIEKIEPE